MSVGELAKGLAADDMHAIAYSQNESVHVKGQSTCPDRGIPCGLEHNLHGASGEILPLLVGNSIT